MQVSFTIENAAHLKTALSTLNALAPVWDLDGEAVDTTPKAEKAKAGATAAPAGKRGRPKKEAAPVENDDDLSLETDDDDLGLDDEEAEAEEPEEPKITLEHVIDVAKAYALKNGRDKTAKIIQRFSAKSIRDVKPADFKMIIKAFEK